MRRRQKAIVCRYCHSPFTRKLEGKGSFPRYCSDGCKREQEKTRCRVKTALLRKSRAEAGLCLDCGVMNDRDTVRCTSCSKRHGEETKLLKAERRSASLCLYCTSTIDGTYGQLCRNHWFVSYAWAKKIDAQVMIELVEQQHKVCPLCGTDLIEGKNGNMALDRIIPAARGGQYELGNVRWLCRRCNQMKRDMLDKELIEQCNRIVDWRCR